MMDEEDWKRMRELYGKPRTPCEEEPAMCLLCAGLLGGAVGGILILLVAIFG